MNTMTTSPAVHEFVAAVRGRLADLTEEEREELVGGLEADLADLVSERGTEALPDPGTYAAELRAAAGFSPVAAVRPSRTRDGLAAWLDRGGATWRRWVRTGDHLGLPAFAQSLRPVWWVVRALCAVTLLVEVYSSQGIFGLTPRRGLLALVAIVLSVQLGRGAWGTARALRRFLSLRLVLVGLNVLAILLVPVMFDRFLHAGNGPATYDAEPGFDPSLATEGLFFGGRQVQNVYPYDAQGRPLVGVQLVDQDGRRLLVPDQGYDDLTEQVTLLTPWRNGRTSLFSVYPMPEQATDPETGEPLGDARLQTPPFASLPPVTLEGVRPSTLDQPGRDAARTRKKGDR